MKFLIIFVAFLACVTAYDVEVELLSEEQWNAFMADDTLSAETRGWILDSQAKKAVRNIVKQLPCGWPERGIPPLAPYTNPELEIHLAKSAADSIVKMLRFRFDGLDDLEIKKLQVSYTFSQKVKYHFNFKELKVKSSLLNSDTFIDLMNEMGIAVRYEGSGPMEFVLENLALFGQFKYKMPFIFGSIKIYKFVCVVSLGGVRSNIGGILGNGGFNRFVNDQIETLIPAIINGNQNTISDMIEDAFVPRINAKLKGNKIWTLLGKLGSTTPNCVATPAPFLAEDL